MQRIEASCDAGEDRRSPGQSGERFPLDSPRKIAVYSGALHVEVFRNLGVKGGPA